MHDDRRWLIEPVSGTGTAVLAAVAGNRAKACRGDLHARGLERRRNPPRDEHDAGMVAVTTWRRTRSLDPLERFGAGLLIVWMHDPTTWSGAAGPAHAGKHAHRAE